MSTRTAVWFVEKQEFRREKALSAGADDSCIVASLEATVDQNGRVSLWFRLNIQVSKKGSTSKAKAKYFGLGFRCVFSPCD